MLVEHPPGVDALQPESALPHRAGRGSASVRGLVLGWLGLIYGLGAGLVLFVSFGWTPEAIAGGAPWTELGLRPMACAGCGFCGLSRAFSLLSHGELLVALSLNPLVLLAWPLTWVLALGGPALFVFRNRRP